MDNDLFNKCRDLLVNKGLRISEISKVCGLSTQETQRLRYLIRRNKLNSEKQCDGWTGKEFYHKYQKYIIDELEKSVPIHWIIRAINHPHLTDKQVRSKIDLIREKLKPTPKEPLDLFADDQEKGEQVLSPGMFRIDEKEQKPDLTLDMMTRIESLEMQVKILSDLIKDPIGQITGLSKEAHGIGRHGDATEIVKIIANLCSLCKGDEND